MTKIQSFHSPRGCVMLARIEPLEIPSMESATPDPPAGRSALLRSLFVGRPWWMNAAMLFCAYMTFIYMPFDMFLKPVSQDQEVFFGYMLTGWAAKATEPLHWAIYAAGAWGFYRMRPWMWPWASLYVAQIVFGMIVWSVLYAPSQPDPGTPGLIGLIMGAVALIGLISLAVGLWRTKGLFRAGPEIDPPPS